MGFIYKITNTINDKVYIGKTTRTISEVCRGKRLTAGGYTWKNGGK